MAVDAAASTPFTASVPRVMASLLICVMLCSCTAPAPEGTGSDPTKRSSTDTGVRIDSRVYGKVVSANAALRFVVMDFAIWRMPVQDQRLYVYRHEQKVGEIKVTGPSIETTVAGDLIAGEARPGDEVRE